MKSSDERAIELKKKLPFVNASDNTVMVPGLWWAPHFDESYIAKLQEGGITAILATQVCWFYDTTLDAFRRLSHLHEFLARHDDSLRLVTSADDLEEVANNRKIGIIVQFHNSLMLENSLGHLDMFFKLGLRAMQLTYQEKNSVATGNGEKNDEGLSKFGMRVIERMNELGIVVDLSHAGPKSYSDALEICKVPPIVSHSCARGACNHVRNLTDDQIKALAEKGGVLGIMAKSFMLKPNGAYEGTTIQDFVNHIDYVSKLVGVDHVGIGLENGYGRNELEMRILPFYHPEVVGAITPTGKYDFERFYSAAGLMDMSAAKLNIMRELVNRGYSDGEIGKIIGQNFLRVFREIWKT